MCGWKNTLKCVKYLLKTKNNYLKSQTKHPLVVEKGYSIKATHSHRERYYLQVSYEKGNTRDITLVNVKCELVTSIPREYVYWRLSQIVKHISCHLKKAL